MSPFLLFLLLILVVFIALGLFVRAQWRNTREALKQAALRASVAASEAAARAAGQGGATQPAPGRAIDHENDLANDVAGNGAPAGAKQASAGGAGASGTSAGGTGAGGAGASGAGASETGAGGTSAAGTVANDADASKASAEAGAPDADAAPYTLDPALLALALSGGSVQRGAQTIGFVAHDIGLLEVTTGRVAASDPLVSPDPPAFTQAVPNGRHPVRVIAARFGEDERIAYALLRFSEASAVRWANARSGEEDTQPLGAGEFFGYGVDSGTGCFMDPHAGRLLSARMEQEDDYFETIIDEMEKTYAHTRSWADIHPDASSPSNVICFSSGWGDGSYPSFFGFDAEGKVAVLVTDFMVVGEE
jgi:hypothetical protein